MERIAAAYRVAGPKAAAAKTARAIAFEQTVELPEALVTAPRILEGVVGRVESVEPEPGARGRPVPGGPRSGRSRAASRGRFLARVSYSLELSGFQVPQLLNLVYGNVSLQRGIRLVELELPRAFLARFKGPNFGVEGLRRLLGVRGRPLLATAIKPMGASLAELAAVGGAFARAGGDIVKDDQNLVDASTAAFRERVSRIQDAVAEANARSGRAALYLPILSAPAEELEERLETALRAGCRGALICPLLAGLDQTRRLAAKYPIVVMAHPASTGAFFQDRAHGIEPGLFLGSLFRLLGADASIFPHRGGRFPFDRAECVSIGERLRRPWGALAPALPAPAGGMTLANLPSMGRDYGEDSVFLVGGSLLGHPGGVEAGTRAFLGAIRKAFDERLEKPEAGVVSACELPASGPAAAADRLAFDPEGFRWAGRAPTAYKKDAALPFRGVTRHELVGKGGAKAAFDLRYFELEPGGFTSLEKHVHTHTVVCLRGEGVLVKGDRRLALKRYDIGAVGPLEVHQLRNESNEPFGFFCIVDRERDRPQAP